MKIGITGHRDLKKENIKIYQLSVNKQLKMLKENYTNLIVYSALADGADRLVVYEAIKLNIDFITVLPMNTDIYTEDFTTDSKKEFEQLIRKSKQVIQMKTIKNTIFCREIQYELASQYISDKSDILFALWDKKFNTLQGGTSETVKYHLQQNKQLWHLKVDRNSL